MPNNNDAGSASLNDNERIRSVVRLLIRAAAAVLHISLFKFVVDVYGDVDGRWEKVTVAAPAEEVSTIDDALQNESVLTSNDEVAKKVSKKKS